MTDKSGWKSKDKILGLNYIPHSDRSFEVRWELRIINSLPSGWADKWPILTSYQVSWIYTIFQKSVVWTSYESGVTRTETRLLIDPQRRVLHQLGRNRNDRLQRKIAFGDVRLCVHVKEAEKRLYCFERFGCSRVKSDYHPTRVPIRVTCVL